MPCIANIISTQLELVLLDHMELWTIIGVLASITLIIVIAITQCRQLRAVNQQQKMYLDEQKRQITMVEHQNNLDSARLVIDLDKVYRTDGFRMAYRLMVNGTIDLGNGEHKEWFVRYINHSQFVCKLFAERLISKSDMQVSYGGLESLLNKNENTREYIEEQQLRYPYLHWYFRYIRAMQSHHGQQVS